jgi:ABC-type cobalamin/Fe3+-siderophores transport system ATPase subunit
MIQRVLFAKIRRWLFQFPACGLLGPRQCGKSTLARQLLEKIPHSNDQQTSIDCAIPKPSLRSMRMTWFALMRASGSRISFLLSRVGFLSCQKHFGSSSQCVRSMRLRPGLRDEAALRKMTLIQQHHQDGDPALAKDTHQA